MDICKSARVAINIEESKRVLGDSVSNRRLSTKVEILRVWIVSLRFSSVRVSFFEDDVSIIPNWGLVFIQNINGDGKAGSFRGSRRDSIFVLSNDLDVPSLLCFEVESGFGDLKESCVIILVYNLKGARLRLEPEGNTVVFWVDILNSMLA